MRPPHFAFRASEGVLATSTHPAPFRRRIQAFKRVLNGSLIGATSSENHATFHGGLMLWG